MTPSMNALLKLLKKGRKDEVLPASILDGLWGRQKSQRVTIRGIRLYAKEGGPLHVQVFTGTRWVSVITYPSLVGPTHATVTALAIKDRLRRSKKFGKIGDKS